MARMMALRHGGAAAALLCAAVVAAEVSSSSSSAPPPLPSSASSSATPDSVYATSGFDALSPLNRAAMLATIVVFLLLSVLSGRELWLLRYGRSASSSSSSSPPLASAASAGPGKHHPTPKHHSYGGIPTPQSATAVPSSISAGSSSSDVSTGAEMRARLFALLFAASSIRVAALVVELTTLRAMETSPAASLYARLLSMFLWLPALLFVSMYGLVLLFWAQLCYACWGAYHPWPRRLFFAFNVLLYLLFVALLAATSTSGAFWRACDLLLGSVYLVGLGGLLYYSARLIQFFRRQGPDEDFYFDLPPAAAGTGGVAPPPRRVSPRQIVLRRISAVCALLSVLFAAKAAYMIGLGVGVVPSEETQYRSPVGVHHVAFEFAMHFVTEFVPCSLLLFFTRKQSTSAAATALDAAGAGGASGTLPSHLSGLTPGSGTAAAPHYGLRGRNNSAFNDDNHSVGSGSLTGYQFQAVQRSYGSTLTTALRSTPGGATSNNTYQSMESNGHAASNTAAHTPSYV